MALKPYFECEHLVLYKGDCLEIMPFIAKQGVNVDAVITDPPYGAIACEWDNALPFDKVWASLQNVCKENTPILLFGMEPFSSKLRLSNLSCYRYDWIWDKGKGSNPYLASKRPMPSYENISVFYDKRPNYSPQYSEGKPYKAPRSGGMRNSANGGYKRKDKDGFLQKDNDGKRHPLQILRYSIHCGSKLHPTQKPVPLIEYLIKTYTNEGDTVLDFTIGSGTTAIAAINTNRRFIGIEMEEKYCEIAKKRILDSLIGDDF